MRNYIRTGKDEFDNFFPLVKYFMENDIMDVVIDGRKIRGFRTPDASSIWIRDHCDMIRGFKYIESDLKSTIEHFAETQSENGRIFDYFTTFPEKLPCERENWTKYVRVPVEADVEFRFIKAIYLAWQATGDDAWVKRLLPRMEKALNYILTHPWRWDKRFKLVKRAYTIDTWDFAYTAGKHHWLQFQINDDTFWGIMHGDNSGYYEAFLIMSKFYELFKNRKRSEYWRRKAVSIRNRMNKVCWNGKFYTHFVKITPVKIPGVDESKQLSLSNPMDINRGVTTHKMAVSIINEYLERRKRTDAFAEWFSIDPPFPDGIFGDEKLKRGAYVNGGIMPLVGGELAKAAFEHGFERYGVDILRRYYSMISKDRATYLWYFPDGTPASVETSTSPEASPTDGWGSTAMLYALIEGLAGIEDRFKLFKNVKLSPRWLSAEIDSAEVQFHYASSGAGFGYEFKFDGEKITLNVISTDLSRVDFHILLPDDAKARSVKINGRAIDFRNLKIEDSRYVDFSSNIRNGASVRIHIK
jgi:hypothetical protein